MKIQVSLSAIPLSIVKKMMRKTPSKANHMYDEIFAKLGEGKSVDKYRIYIPLEDANIRQHKVVAPQEIIDYLSSIKFSLNDYLLGTALMPDGKRTVRLGKALSKRPDLLRQFENDPQRKLVRHDKMWVVISRHPYDILGMSFDRGWSSCMNLEDGVNRHYLKGDLKQGTLVAYLIKDTDKNINNPISRIAIRPYYEKKSIRKTKKNIYLVPSGVYGTDSEKFETIVKKFCALVNDKAPHGHYVLKRDLYDDGEGSDLFHINPKAVETLSDEECIAMCRQPRLESDVIEALLKRKNPAVTYRLVAAHMHLIADESLMSIAKDRDMRSAHRQMAQKQKKLSLNVLLALTESTDTVTLHSLVSQTNRVEILKVLMNSSEAEVRSSVADNFVVSKDILIQLSNDENYEVVTAVLNSSNSDLDIVKRVLARTEDFESLQITRWKRTVISRTDLPFDFTLSLIKENLEKPFLYPAISERRDLPVEIIRTIYDKTMSNIHNEIYADIVMKNIAKRDNTPSDIIEKLANSEFEVANILVRRDDLTSELLNQILQKNPNDYKVAMNILDRPSVTEDHMKLLVTSQDEDIVRYAIASGHMDDKAAKYFVENGVATFQRNAARRIAGEHPLALAIALYSKDLRVILNLVDANDEEFPENVYMALMKNSICTSSMEGLYALYYRADSQIMKKVSSMFSSRLKELDEFASHEGRYSIAEIDRKRL